MARCPDARMVERYILEHGGDPFKDPGFQNHLAICPTCRGESGLVRADSLVHKEERKTGGGFWSKLLGTN